MDSSKQIFTGKSGKLIIGRNGVTIERNFSQASQQRTKRLTHIDYSEIESMRHRYAADKPGYIELKAKPGGEASSLLNRRQRIHFDAASAHRFRRAQKQIARKIQEQQATNQTGSDQSTETLPNSPSAYFRPAPMMEVGPSTLQTPPASLEIDGTTEPPPPVPALTPEDKEQSVRLPFRGLSQ